ncbi:MAG: hypothetical protein AB7N61_27035 [Acidimicrobiia bacterium]
MFVLLKSSLSRLVRTGGRASLVAMSLLLLGCSSPTDQSQNHTLAGQLHLGSGIDWLSESEYTFCSHESCSSGNDRHGVSVLYNVSPTAKISELADRFESALPGWTRTDYCDLGTGRAALDRCPDAQRSYVVFTGTSGGAFPPESTVFLERLHPDRPGLLTVNIDTDTGK